jgi:hypothetical protein
MNINTNIGVSLKGIHRRAAALMQGAKRFAFSKMRRRIPPDNTILNSVEMQSEVIGINDINAPLNS